MTNTRLSLRIGHILVKFRDAGLKLSKNTKHSILKKIRKIAEQLRKLCMPATCCWVAKCCGAATCCGAVEGVPFGFRGRDNWNFVS